jgi:DinB superfamily
MSEAEHLSDAVRALSVFDDHGLFTSFSTAVAGLTAAQAAAVPAPRFSSAWAVLNHVRFWQEVTLLQLRGQPVDRSALGAENGWPPPGELADEEGWQAAARRCLEANLALAEAAAALSHDALTAPLAPGRAAPWQLIQGMIAHNAYHTCEAISIRHTLGLWLERT